MKSANVKKILERERIYYGILRDAQQCEIEDKLWIRHFAELSKAELENALKKHRESADRGHAFPMICDVVRHVGMRQLSKKEADDLIAFNTPFVPSWTLGDSTSNRPKNTTVRRQAEKDKGPVELIAELRERMRSRNKVAQE